MIPIITTDVDFFKNKIPGGKLVFQDYNAGYKFTRPAGNVFLQLQLLGDTFHGIQ